MRDIYIGLFYWLYEMSERALSRWWSEWKAYIMLAWLEACILLSISIYYSHFFAPIKNIDPFLVVLFVFFVVKSYLIFEKDDRWKGYIEEFRTKSKEERRKSLYITILIIVLIIANLIYSFYIGEQDRKQLIM